jgi:hypothetical protein
MPSIDAEGLLHLFNRYPSGLVAVEDLMADVAAHEIDALHAQAALRELIAHGTLTWAPGAKLARPD